MAMEIEPLMRASIARIQKVEWPTAFITAYDKALCSKNILGGFPGTGLHLFLPTKVFYHITESLVSPQLSRPSIPQNISTPFNEAIFTDSPPDFNAV